MKSMRNRRSGDDRRNEDRGPPSGWSERRRSVERRLPTVLETSFAEWIACLRKRPCKTQ